MPNCKACGQSCESLGQLRKHYKDVGHPTKTGTGSRKGGKRGPLARGDEPTVLAACVQAFEGSPLDDGGRRRVLNYLCDRYLPDTGEDAA